MLIVVPERLVMRLVIAAATVSATIISREVQG